MASITPLTIRERNDLPRRDAAGKRSSNISFCHPNYPDMHNVLFRLPRHDDGGVHHGTALAICQIISNNAFNGFLCSTADGGNKVPHSFDDILTNDRYYFIVPNSNDAPNDSLPYPVVPSFRDWQFPHDNVPEPWLNATRQEQGRQDRCAVSGRHYSLNRSHVIPSAELDWYYREGMGANTISMSINGEDNIIALRSDIYFVFDSRTFVFAPKNNIFVVNVFRNNKTNIHNLAAGVAAEDFAEDFHNLPVIGLAHVPPEFLFARFAWACMILIKPFLVDTAMTRRVVVRSGDGRDIQDLGGRELDNRYGGGGTRSSSPMKRPTNSATPLLSSSAQDEQDDELNYQEDRDWMAGIYQWQRNVAVNGWPEDESRALRRKRTLSEDEPCKKRVKGLSTPPETRIAYDPLPSPEDIITPWDTR
ncbi:hypothetical protein GGS24DRAFT_464181 [Hypoxylon argillaceum]|nr:hypothetical protein GGS24DRAFT_464181 [Hypoxylon argillaceum]